MLGELSHDALPILKFKKIVKFKLIIMVRASFQEDTVYFKEARITYQNHHTNLQIVLLKFVKNGFCVKVDFLQASYKVIRGHEPRGYVG